MKNFKYESFAADIEKHIREGRFLPGQRLPSVRSLMKQYGSSMTTIQHGYEQLVMEGLVDSKPKSGYYVRQRAELTNIQEMDQKGPAVRDPVFANNLAMTTSLRAGQQLSEFNVAMPGDLFMPQKLLLRTMQQVIREYGARLLRYYPASGSTELKNNIIKRAAGYGSVIGAGELVITDGALQSVYIALAAVCNSGDVIAVESPCVFSVLQAIRMLGLRVVEVHVDQRQGFDTEQLKKACISNKIKAILLTPNFHNPTGALLTEEKKKALLEIVHEFGIPLIENDIYGDLHFADHRPSNIRRYDSSGLVMTYSSYSKTLAPGIRLGWLSAGKFMHRAEQIKFALGSSVSPIFQETVNKLLSTTSFERHIRSLRQQLAANADRTAELLRKYFPAGVLFSRPSGGYNIWAQMPDHVDMDDFYLHCETVGVRFTPGYTFSFSNSFRQHFRLVFADKYSLQRVGAIKSAGERFR